MLAITLGACLATGRDPGWDTAQTAALTPPSEGGAPRPVVLGATETSCYVTENNAQLFAALASACAAYEELVVVLNVFDSDDDGQPRSLNCPPELTPNETLPACVRQVTHVPGMKTAFWRDAVRPEDVDRLAPGAEVVWLFDNDMSVGSDDFDLARTVRSHVESTDQGSDRAHTDRAQTHSPPPAGLSLPRPLQLSVRSSQGVSTSLSLSDGLEAEPAGPMGTMYKEACLTAHRSG